MCVCVDCTGHVQALGHRAASDPPSRTHGVAYLVPDDKAKAVLAGLDFREKGGYTRAVVDVLRTSGARFYLTPSPPVKCRSMKQTCGLDAEPIGVVLRHRCPPSSFEKF